MMAISDSVYLVVHTAVGWFFTLGSALLLYPAASHNILVSERCNCNALKAQGNSKLSHPSI